MDNNWTGLAHLIIIHLSLIDVVSYTIYGGTGNLLHYIETETDLSQLISVLTA